MGVERVQSSYTNQYLAEQLQTADLFLDSRLRRVSRKEQIRPSERIVFITGVAGQDGSYLGEYLLGLG